MANNKGVDKRALEMMRERLLLFPQQASTLSSQQWKAARSLHVDVSEAPLEDFLRSHSWTADQLILCGDKLKIGSLTISVGDGVVRCKLGSNPSAASGRLDIVTGICWTAGRFLFRSLFVNSCCACSDTFDVILHVCVMSSFSF